MNYALRLPDYYKHEIEALKGDVSINRFIVNAATEKITTLKTVDYLQERAKNGSRAHALDILAKASDKEILKTVFLNRVQSKHPIPKSENENIRTMGEGF